jgi:hypothetical protein
MLSGVEMKVRWAKEVHNPMNMQKFPALSNQTKFYSNCDGKALQ